MKGLVPFIKEHSIETLCVAAVCGTVASCILTGIGCTKATKIICKKEYEEKIKMDKKEKAKEYVKQLIPAAASLTGTVACEIAETAVSRNKINNLSAAVTSLGTTAYAAYEKLSKEQKKEMIKSNSKINNLKERFSELTDDEILVYDMFMDDYLIMTPTILEVAEGKINRFIRENEFISYRQFLDILRVELDDDNVPPWKYSLDCLGWSRSLIEETRTGWLDLDYEIVPIEEDSTDLSKTLNVYCLEYGIPPITEYDKM